MSFISVEVLVWDFSFENSPCASDWGVRIDGRDWESVKTSFPRQAVLKNGISSSAKKKKDFSSNLSIPASQLLSPICNFLFWPKPCSLHRSFASLWWVYTMGFIHGWFPGGVQWEYGWSWGRVGGDASSACCWGHASHNVLCSGVIPLWALWRFLDRHKKVRAELLVCCLLCNWE